VDVNYVVSVSGASMETLKEVAQHIVAASAPIIIPGATVLGRSNGLATAEAILTLNALTDNYGKPGGIFISPLGPNEDPNGYHRSASTQEMSDFIGKMKSGAVKTLFIHGTNPVFDLPISLGFKEALANVATVISFGTFPDETAVQADYIFPNHHALESWGYQRPLTGTPQPVLAGAQPVVIPMYDTRSTVDVLIAAAGIAGGKAAQALPFKDEVEFIQSKLMNLVPQTGGSFTAPEINSFAAYFQQHGGWWQKDSALINPDPANALGRDLTVSQTQFANEGDFFFLPFVSPTLGVAGANVPWLQELADPTTTVMWNTWVEMNPETAKKLGIDDDDVIRIVSEAGAVEASVYKYPAIRPDTIAMPFGQGHTAYGRYAEGRGVNPNDLMSAKFNEAGDLTFSGMKVKIEKTGKKSVLSRLEGKLGVYGFTEEK